MAMPRRNCEKPCTFSEDLPTSHEVLTVKPTTSCIVKGAAQVAVRHTRGSVWWGIEFDDMGTRQPADPYSNAGSAESTWFPLRIVSSFGRT